MSFAPSYEHRGPLAGTEWCLITKVDKFPIPGYLLFRAPDPTTIVSVPAPSLPLETIYIHGPCFTLLRSHLKRASTSRREGIQAFVLGGRNRGMLNVVFRPQQGA